MPREQWTSAQRTRRSLRALALGLAASLCSATAGAQVPTGRSSSGEVEPQPPTPGELAAIEAEIDAREVQRMMRFRARWRGFLDAGPTWLVGKGVALDRVEVRAFEPTLSVALGGGVRRALNPMVDLRLRASATFPRAVSYGLTNGGCPDGRYSGRSVDGEISRWSVLAEAGVRLRFGPLAPVYLGADVLVGTMWFVGTRSTSTDCPIPGTSGLSSDRITASTGVSIAPLIGGALSGGVHFGSREQFELNFQSGYVFHGLASDANGITDDRGGAFTVGFILLQLTFGWAFD